MIDTSIAVFCPHCLRSANVRCPVEAVESERLKNLEAPEGFRKVQTSAFSNAIFFYCMQCAVPAEIHDFVTIRSCSKH